MRKKNIALQILDFLKNKGFSTSGVEVFDKDNQPIKDIESNAQEITTILFDYITPKQEILGSAGIVLGHDDLDNPTLIMNYGKELASHAADNEFQTFIKSFKQALNRMGVTPNNFSYGEIGADAPQLRKYANTSILESGFGEIGGSIRTSVQPLENLRIIIKHSDRIDPSIRAARSRKIERIYLANSQSERFLLPFNSLLAARAMARHVFNGGTVYDQLGHIICELIDELFELSKFYRKTKTIRIEDTKLLELVGTSRERYSEIKKILNSLHSQGGYQRKSYELTGGDTEFDDNIPSGYEHLSLIDEGLLGAMPYIWRAHNRKHKNSPREVDEFTAWVNNKTTSELIQR